jgi:tRNA-specific adenosine deaminase 1
MCLHYHVCPIDDIRVFGVERRHEGGDASTRAVALIQDPKMASLKNSSGTRAPLQPSLSRGREGYAQFGIIRTKPGMHSPYEPPAVTHFTKSGRADAPATLCMSCSDKIAMWSSVGVQGALLVDLGLEPIKLSSVVIGGVHGHEEFYGDLELIRRDCRRAFGERLQGAALPDAYEVRIPEVHWTPRRFSGSKCRPTEERTSSNECEAFSFHRW